MEALAAGESKIAKDFGGGAGSSCLDNRETPVWCLGKENVSAAAMEEFLAKADAGSLPFTKRCAASGPSRIPFTREIRKKFESSLSLAGSSGSAKIAASASSKRSVQDPASRDRSAVAPVKKKTSTPFTKPINASPLAEARKKTVKPRVQEYPRSHGRAASSVATRARGGSSVATRARARARPNRASYRLIIPDPVSNANLYLLPSFAEAMELLKSETFQPDKIAAWAAKLRRRAEAFSSDNIEDGWAFEDEEDEEEYGKLSDDDEYREEGDLELDESCLEYFDSDEEEEGFLCAIVCDFLCDLPNQSSDRDTIRKVLGECGKNHSVESQCSSDPLRKDTFQIDLRGLYSEDAQKTLRTHLFRFSREPQPFLKYLDVIVGCSIHGIGEGKLRQTVIDLLKDCKTLKWTESCNDAIISINLEDSAGWMASELAEDDVAVEETNMKEKVEAKDKPELCTIICDFLCDLPTKQRPDRRIARKVLAGLKSCCEGGCGVDEDTMWIDVRGLYVDKVEDVLIDRLYKLTFRSSTMKFLNVTIGCKVHGVGKRNLERAVVGILMRDETIKWEEDHSGAVIRIEIDKKKDYHRCIGRNSS